MSRPADPTRPGNPFATRHVRPGAISYRFPEGQSLDELVERLRRNQWQGQIVGPHGSGKSTLLAALVPAIQRAGRPVIGVELHNGQRRLLKKTWTAGHKNVPVVLVIDGYEQLSWWNRLVARWRCRRRGWGLLVTCHAPVRLPRLWQTSADDALAQQIVGDLLADDWSRISPAEVTAALARHNGNLRETLFDLYDAYRDGG